MATTTNYAWTTPDDSSLVKDGASAIRALGTAIDTSMNTALGTKKAGMVLLNTTSFSAVSSQSISDVFSTTYDNYHLIMNFTSSADVLTTWRLRVSGADNSTSNYNSHMSQSSSTANTYAGAGSASATSWFLTSSLGTTSVKGMNINLLNPFATANTLFNGTYSYSGTGGAAAYNGGHIFGGFAATTSFTGFSLIPASGTITGTISVYGVNK